MNKLIKEMEDKVEAYYRDKRKTCKHETTIPVDNYPLEGIFCTECKTWID